MARKTPQTSLKAISEINLTPLMDLTFILLITFIITFPLIEQGIAVNLPKGKAKELTDEEARTVTVDAEGAIYLDNSPITLDELTDVMMTLEKESGFHFDPELVEIFFSISDIVRSIRLRYMDEGSPAVD